MSVKVNGVDYNQLISNPTLLSDFENAMKTQIAAQSGHGVTPDDVDLTLSPGSIAVEAAVNMPSGTSASDVQSDLCGSAATAGQDMAAAISNLPGMSAASTGTISAEVTAACGEATTTADPGRRLQSVSAPPTQDSMENCDPQCVPGQGICSDKICFCRTPYTGIRCEREMQTSWMRFSYTATVCIAVGALVVGLMLGVIIFKLVSPNKLAVGANLLQAHGETWTAG